MQDNISQVASEMVSTKSKLTETVSDAKVLEQRLEVAKNVIEITMHDADMSHAKLQLFVSTGFQEQAVVKNAIQQLVDKAMHSDTIAKIESRITTIENIMAASNTANNEAMNNLGCALPKPNSSVQ